MLASFDHPHAVKVYELVTTTMVRSIRWSCSNELTSGRADGCLGAQPVAVCAGCRPALKSVHTSARTTRTSRARGALGLGKLVVDAVRVARLDDGSGVA